MTKTTAAITAVGSYIPDFVLSNALLETMVDTNDEWITTRTGIKERRLLKDKDKGTSYLAIQAAKDLIEKKQLDPSEIDLVLIATATPDLAVASTAACVASNIGATNAFSYDLQAACSSFLYGMSTASAYIESGRYKKVLLIGADKMSSIIDYTDRATCIIFGDGAGAVVLEAYSCSGDKEDRGILSVDLNSDGNYKDILHVDGGVASKTTGYLRMEGKEVFKHAVEKLARTSENAMAKAGVKSDDVDWVVPHQANIRIIQGTARKMGIPDEKVIKTVQDHGNTSAASIPLALSVASGSGQIVKNDLIVTEAIGGGLAWGAIVLRW